MKLRFAPTVPARKLLALSALSIVGLAVAGCDSAENADIDRGRALFIESCGRCHTLAESGSSGTVGPDLDAAFADARAIGQDTDTFAGEVEYQIETPRKTRPSDESNPLYMPPQLVTGQDEQDVAAYVAAVAGVPGIKAPVLATPDLFATQCGSCHTLAATGSTGQIGPNLDDVLPGQTAAAIKDSILNPSANLSPGFQDQMTPTFGDSLDPKQIDALVKFLTVNAGKPTK